MKKAVCAVSAVLIAGILANPVGVHAAEEQRINTMTNSVEGPNELSTGGKYLYSATDGISSGSISAEFVSDISPVGGYQKADSPKLTKARKKLFKRAFKGFVGSEVTPVAYIASQVVAGTNHKYLCRIKAAVPNAKEYYCFVVIYEDPEGNVSIKEIRNTENETKINGLSGGWFQASGAKVTRKVKKAVKKALSGLAGVSYKPVAILSQQVVAGMNYCVLCESRVIYPGASTGYALVYFYQGLDGSVELVDIEKIVETNSDNPAEPQPGLEPEFSLKTVIVSVSKDASETRLKEIFTKLGLSILYDYDSLNMYAVSLAEETDAQGIADLIEKLESYDEILTASRDYIIYLDDIKKSCLPQAGEYLLFGNASCGGIRKNLPYVL